MSKWLWCFWYIRQIYFGLLFTEPMFLKKTHILIYWHINIFNDHLCLKYCIFTKPSKTVYLINTHTLVFQYARCNCWLLKDLRFNCIFLGKFHILLHTCYKHCIFMKPSQILSNTIVLDIIISYAILPHVFIGYGSQKCRDDKQTFVIIYSYVSQIFFFWYFLIFNV